MGRALRIKLAVAEEVPGQLKNRLESALLELEELRFLNGWSRDKKKGSSRCDRLPLALLEELYFTGPQDYRAMLPNSLPKQFTVQDYQKAAGLSRKDAGVALHVLHDLGAAKRVGKRGNAFVYAIAEVQGTGARE